MLGIVEEQHPDRARLFMQWKRMHWPVMVDSLDQLEVPVVPVTLAIDEHGIVRARGLSLADAATIEKTFVDREYEPPEPLPTSSPPAAPDLEAKHEAAKRGGARAHRDYADALATWGGPGRVDDAIAAYGRALEADPAQGFTHFRAGVAFRRRYDSDHRRGGDFQKAVDHWSRALDLDPNNYIWRRRLQQYGPRLDKPYPFYGWIEEARSHITARGQTPTPLVAEPGATERAAPLRRMPSPERAQEPDPRGRIARDAKLVQAETTVVPGAVRPGESARLHVVLRPNRDADAHWNNEVGGLVFWVHPPEDWTADARRHEIGPPATAVSDETRTIELELAVPENAEASAARISGYALYYVCEGVRGTCLYRRQDVDARVRVVEE